MADEEPVRQASLHETTTPLPLQDEALAACLAQLATITRADQVGELAAQVTAVVGQVQQAYASLTSRVDELSSRVAVLTGLTTLYESHYHLMSGGSEVLGDVAGHPRVLLVQDTYGHGASGTSGPRQ